MNTKLRDADYWARFHIEADRRKAFGVEASKRSLRLFSSSVWRKREEKKKP